MTTGKTAVLVAIGIAVLALPQPGRAAGQTLQAMRAEWRDLETWSRYLQDTRESELGLGLQVAGPTGTTFVAFIGRLDIRNATAPPKDVTIQIGASKLSNPNVVRRPTLMLDADPGTEAAIKFDLTPRLMVDDPSPGAIVENGIVQLKADEFVRLCESEKLNGQALGFPMTFRGDQIAAMWALAERLHMSPKKPEPPKSSR